MTAALLVEETVVVDRVRSRAVGQAVTILGLALLGFVAQLTVLGTLQHARAQQVAYADLRETMALATIPVGTFDDEGRPVVPGTPIALLEIPRIGVREVVGEGTSGGVLADGPGLRRDTPLPGQPGTSVVMGRRAAYGGPFARLADLRPGDRITVTTGQGSNSFTVLDLRYPGDPQADPVASGHGRLVLVTAAGDPFVPDDAIRVDADLTSPAQPPGRVAPSGSLPPDEQILAQDDGALTAGVLWLQLLVLVALLVTWVQFRVGFWQAWLVGAPVLCALALLTGDQAVRLLPNVL